MLCIPSSHASKQLRLMELLISFNTYSSIKAEKRNYILERKKTRSFKENKIRVKGTMKFRSQILSLPPTHPLVDILCTALSYNAHCPKFCDVTVM